MRVVPMSGGSCQRREGRRAARDSVGMRSTRKRERRATRTLTCTTSQLPSLTAAYRVVCAARIDRRFTGTPRFMASHARRRPARGAVAHSLSATFSSTLAHRNVALGHVAPPPECQQLSIVSDCSEHQMLNDEPVEVR